VYAARLWLRGGAVNKFAYHILAHILYFWDLTSCFCMRILVKLKVSQLRFEPDNLFMGLVLTHFLLLV